MTTDFNLLHDRLETEWKHLIEELEQLKAGVRQGGEWRQEKPLGDDEAALEYLELDKYLALQKRIIDRLAKVQHALHKFDEGTYGLCDACGQPIDPARLEALPEASLCLSCKVAEGLVFKLKRM